jgi:uncharacterized repeat protein (TIGR04076 family)
MAKVKVKVIKTLSNREVFGDKPPVTYKGDPVCPRLKEGQEFVFDPSQFPEGFCPWAYSDIQRDITLIRMGQSSPLIKEKNTLLASCSDGARPVIFKIELLEA